MRKKSFAICGKIIIISIIMLFLLQICIIAIDQGTPEMRERGREIAALINSSEIVKNELNRNGIILYEVTWHSTMLKHHITLFVYKSLCQNEKEYLCKQINVYLQNTIYKNEKVIIHICQR